MSEEILINVTPPETRVAVIENGVVQEIIIERSRNRSLVSNIYKGKVMRVLPGMQAAFIDIGLERSGFLHISGLVRDSEEQKNTDITQILHEGQSLLVQVVKAPIGTKGARLTANISIPSRFLVFIPALSTVGVSQKIHDSQERNRLRQILSHHCDSCEIKGGFVARTVAESVDEFALRADMQFLARLWCSIQETLKTSKPTDLVYEDLPLVSRALRDLAGPGVERIRIDSRNTWSDALEFAEKFNPEFTNQIEYYSGERPIFELFGVEEEIQKVLGRKVDLKSGGHLVIEQTEAMTTIDVNTGAFVGHRNLEETIFKTNLEAAQAISRQLRLRNLGGIIVLDFIDMEVEEHQRQVLRSLERCLAKDHSKTQISGISSLGLVEMSRKRTSESLAHILTESCPVCRGKGLVKTTETVCYEIYREILREVRQFDVESLLLIASQEVIDLLISDESENFAELEQFINITIRLQAETTYYQEQYDVVLI